jgi:DUF4097 and DUF4098 domain-containing protein YvlB
MRPFLSLTALFIAAALTQPAAIAAPDSHSHSVSSSDEDTPAATCADLHIQIENRPATIRSEEKSIPKSVGTLTIHSEANGGLQVHGWDQDHYSITACKALDPERSDADQFASQIKLNVDRNNVSVSGPSDHHHWTVFLLIRAPKSADLSLNSNNGPVSIYNVDGKLTAQAINGPVSLRNFSGDADISAQNGPIDIAGNSGNLRLHTENGPISVALDGQAWKGKGLQADAQNGPVELRVPKNYQSGVLIESNGNSPMSCHASVCDAARKTWDEDQHRIEFGNSPAIIHLTTVNGPVSVRQGNDKS